MRRQVSGLITALALVSVVPADAAAPFGRFGGIAGGDNSGAGLIGLHGWALDDDGVASVDIVVDGVSVGRAEYGLHRPGVAQNHPGYPDSNLAGYAYQLDTTQFLNGLHTVQALITSEIGEVRLTNSKPIEFANTTHNLVPFGRIYSPEDSATLAGNCDLFDANRRYTVVSGFALDSGVESGDTGIGYVELLLDGVILYNSRRDCTFDFDRGGFTQCYGLPSEGVQANYPSLDDSPLAGFRFVMDVGALISGTGYALGSHVLTMRAGDVSGQISDFDEIQAFFTCDDFLPNEPGFGNIGEPRNGRTYSGTVRFVGWALDWEGVAEVRIHVNGIYRGNAVYGGARPGVTTLYPGYPDMWTPGWYFDFDTTEVADGESFLDVEVIDFTGAATIIGSQEFRVLNSP